MARTNDGGRRSRDGLRWKSGKWYYRFVDDRGIERERAGTTDRRTTLELRRKATDDAARVKRGADDRRALELRDHAKAPLEDHVAAWRSSLESRGNTPAYVDLTVARVRRLLAVSDGAAVADVLPPKATPRADLDRYEAAVAGRLAKATLAVLDVDRVSAALSALERSGTGSASVKHYRRAVLMFSRWMHLSGRSREHALRALRPRKGDDPRHVRRAPDADERRRLIAAAESGPDAFGASGPDRAVLYRVALGTGFRAKELRSLVPDSFRLDGDEPSVRLSAGAAKNSKAVDQPIAPTLAARLRPWLAGKPPGVPVFQWIEGRSAAMVRVDLAAAGIEYATADGLADFHSLRTSYVTALIESGANVKEVQALARHANPLTTLKHYAKVKPGDLRRVVAALPDPAAEPEPGDDA